MKTSVGRTTLEIASGDITDYEVDAIAIPAGPQLSMGAGVAGALKRVGGEAVETEAALQGPVEPGEAVVTTGHHLKAQWVIHAAAMDGHLETNANLVARATYSALSKADSAHARSLVLPAFVTGVGGFPLYQCASVMVAATMRYLGERKKTGLRRIVFVADTAAGRAAFGHALAGVGRF
jgi:O-acetyl-ADP-ribose deacetylase (regulator of RNase III)